MPPLTKSIAARLPVDWQLALKRLLYARQIRRGTFATSEPEYHLLPDLLQPGDWALDIGANVGHYTRRMSERVGSRGRVIAFEPIPATFSLLAANARLFPHANVTLINAAASDQTRLAGMAIPRFDSGLANYYEAHVAPHSAPDLAVLTLAIDSLALDPRIALVKIDAEDHESAVLDGMSRLIERDHPVLIVETGSRDVANRLESAGYTAEKLPGSPNLLFRPRT